MRNFLIVVIVFLPATVFALSGNVVIEGAEDSQDLLRTLARGFERLHPGVQVVVPDGIGSSGGIRKVREGKSAMARISRPLDQNETKYGLTYRVYARCPVVFFLNGAPGVDNLTYEDIVGIYSGRIKDWQELKSLPGKIYFIGREAGDSGRRAVSRYIPDLKDLAAGGKTYYSALEAVDAVKAHKGTIGYGLMTSIRKSGLKITKVNGVYPSVENVRSGRYELSTPLGIVYGMEALGPAERAFADFLYAAEGRRIITEYGCVPMSK